MSLVGLYRPVVADPSFCIWVYRIMFVLIVNGQQWCCCISHVFQCAWSSCVGNCRRDRHGCRLQPLASGGGDSLYGAAVHAHADGQSRITVGVVHLACLSSFACGRGRVPFIFLALLSCWVTVWLHIKCCAHAVQYRSSYSANLAKTSWQECAAQQKLQAVVSHHHHHHHHVTQSSHSINYRLWCLF
jgi:hypothetical protein